MATIRCYVCEHYTVELDADEVKQQYGSLSKSNIEDAAFEQITFDSPYDTTVVIEEIEKEEKVVTKKPRKGRGSY